jgi:hypothetical protein
MGRKLAWTLLLLLPAALWPAREAARARSRSGAELPPIVFVSRSALPDSLRGQVPGLGPHGAFAGAGGRLLERASDGRVRELVPAGRLFDVADPAVSDDGTRVAFAGRERADAPWRIWTVSRSLAVRVGEEPLACATCDAAAAGAEADDPGDDADPTWWGDTLLYVSTRGAERSLALYDRTPVTQLWVRTPDGRRASVTHEANGVLDPVADRGRRRLLFARWWFNPWHADPAGGVTRATTATADSVNLWQVVSARLVRGVDGRLRLDDLQLAAGGTVPRRSGMGVQPEPLAGGGMLAVAAHNMGLAPRPGTLAVVRYGNAPSAGRRLAGAAIGDESADPYTEAANLRAPAACAPAALEDGRIVCAVDPGGRGDFGLWLLDARGDRVATLVDSAGAWELDPAPVPVHERVREQPAGKPKRDDSHEVISQPGQMPTFRYLNLDVFGSKGDAQRIEGAKLHVYRLDRSGTLLLIAQAPVPRSGRVDLTLPAATPLFEMLVDAGGKALLTAHGPAQVRGFNAGAPASTSRCSGCHLGHSVSP